MEGIFPGVNDKHLPKRCLKARWRYDAPGTIPREGCTAAEEGVSITSTFPNVHADPKCKKSINWFVPKHDIYSPSSL